MPEPELDGVDGEAQSPSRIKFLREWGGGGGGPQSGIFHPPLVNMTLAAGC